MDVNSETCERGRSDWESQVFDRQRAEVEAEEAARRRGALWGAGLSAFLFLVTVVVIAVCAGSCAPAGALPWA